MIFPLSDFYKGTYYFDKSKRYGQIITMQTPATYAKDIDDALLLYSNGGTIDVTAPTWEEVLQKFKEAFKHLKQIAPYVKKPQLFIDKLNEIK